MGISIRGHRAKATFITYTFYSEYKSSLVDNIDVKHNKSHLANYIQQIKSIHDFLPQFCVWVRERLLSAGPVVGGGRDNLQIFDLAKNHLTMGSDHKINDFCFFKCFISMKFDPHQVQKTIFHWFEQCGISLDMFERVKWPVLRNLSLISIIMRIREKKLAL